MKKKFKFFFYRIKKKVQKKKKLSSIKKKNFFLNFFFLKPFWLFTLIRTKNNFFFLGSRANGQIVFWFTGKQLGFKRRQLKSPYTIDAFYELFLYLLKKYNIQIIVCQILKKKII